MTTLPSRLSLNTIYIFIQYNRIKGNNINGGYIDTVMLIIQFNSCKNIKMEIRYIVLPHTVLRRTRYI